MQLCLALSAVGAAAAFSTGLAPSAARRSAVVRRAAAPSGSSAAWTRRSLLASAPIALAAPLVASAGPTVTTTAGGIKYFDPKEGDGSVVQKGDVVVLSYIGYLNDGTAFDLQHDGATSKNKPVTLQYGEQGFVPGLTEALEGMRAGGERRAIIPPSLGFGDTGLLCKDGECLIPPKETLKYTFKLLRVSVAP
jgi:hypothetical protein